MNKPRHFIYYHLSVNGSFVGFRPCNNLNGSQFSINEYFQEYIGLHGNKRRASIYNVLSLTSELRTFIKCKNKESKYDSIT